jgi:hypothetical protein
MEPKGLLPSPQEACSGPYPEPDENNTYHLILVLYDPYQYYVGLEVFTAVTMKNAFFRDVAQC